MGTQKSRENASIQDALTNSDPITHFFYEYQGERSLDPSMLIESGIALWHEQTYTNQEHDNSHLWQFAECLLEARQDTPMYSWVEWLKYIVTMGDLVPDKWDRSKPYPYKGLLISAIYFQEARRLCIEGNPDRAWHIIAMAYYHLGMNTTRSAVQNTSRAAKMMHAARSEKVRALVLGALARIKRDGSADSIDKAKDKVVELFREKHHAIKDWLSEFDTLVSEKTKGRSKAKQKNDVFDRIRNMLDRWALPSGPYPEIAEAFSHFGKRKPKMATKAINSRKTSEDVPTDESDYYLSLINFLEDGRVVTVKLSPKDQAS